MSLNSSNPEPQRPISIKMGDPKYAKSNSPAFMRGDNPSDSASLWLDTKVNFLNEIMKFMPRNVTNAITSHYEGKDRMEPNKKNKTTDRYADSVYNQEIFEKSLWKGQQSEIFGKKTENKTMFGGIFENIDLDGDKVADVNSSRLTGLLGVPYDGELALGTLDGHKLEVAKANDQSKATLKYKDSKDRLRNYISDKNDQFIPILGNISGQEEAKIFREGVNFHPTIVDMQHTTALYNSNAGEFVVDMDGDGFADSDKDYDWTFNDQERGHSVTLSNTAVSTSLYQGDYLYELGITAPVVNYQNIFNSFMQGSLFNGGLDKNLTEKDKTTYNRMHNYFDDKSVSGDFSVFLNILKKEIQLESGGDAFDYVPNIYEIARSGSNVVDKIYAKLGDKGIFYLSMLMLESRRRYMTGISSVFSVNNANVDIRYILNKYGNENVWSYDQSENRLYIDVSTKAKAQKMYNYFIPDEIGEHIPITDAKGNKLTGIKLESAYTKRKNSKTNWLKRRALEYECYKTGFDVYKSTVMTALTSYFPLLDNIANLPKNISDLKNKIKKMLGENKLITTDFDKLIKEIDTLLVSESSGLESIGKDYLRRFKDYVCKDTVKIFSGQPSAFRDSLNKNNTIKAINILADNLEGKEAIISRVANAMSTLADKQINDSYDSKDDDFSDTIQSLFRSGEFSGTTALSFLEKMIEKQGRLFVDIEQIDKFNKSSYGAVNYIVQNSVNINVSSLGASAMGYYPEYIAKNTLSSTYVKESKRTLSEDGTTVAEDFSSNEIRQVDKIYLQMAYKMQKMNTFYLMQLFASPFEGKGTENSPYNFDFATHLREGAEATKKVRSFDSGLGKKASGKMTLKKVMEGFSAINNNTLNAFCNNFLKKIENDIVKINDDLVQGDGNSGYQLADKVSGYFEAMDLALSSNDYKSFKVSYEQLKSYLHTFANVQIQDNNGLFVDKTGDGKPDLLLPNNVAKNDDIYWDLINRLRSLHKGVDFTGAYASTISSKGSLNKFILNNFKLANDSGVMSAAKLDMDSEEHKKAVHGIQKSFNEAIKKDNDNISAFLGALYDRMQNINFGKTVINGDNQNIRASFKNIFPDVSLSRLGPSTHYLDLSDASVQDCLKKIVRGKHNITKNQLFEGVNVPAIVRENIWNTLINMGKIDKTGNILSALKKSDLPVEIIGLTRRLSYAEKKQIVDNFNVYNLGGPDSGIYAKLLKNIKDISLNNVFDIEGKGLSFSVKESLQRIFNDPAFLRSIEQIEKLYSKFDSDKNPLFSLSQASSKLAQLVNDDWCFDEFSFVSGTDSEYKRYMIEIKDITRHAGTFDSTGFQKIVNNNKSNRGNLLDYFAHIIEKNKSYKNLYNKEVEEIASSSIALIVNKVNAYLAGNLPKIVPSAVSYTIETGDLVNINWSNSLDFKLEYNDKYYNHNIVNTVKGFRIDFFLDQAAVAAEGAGFNPPAINVTSALVSGGRAVQTLKEANSDSLKKYWLLNTVSTDNTWKTLSVVSAGNTSTFNSLGLNDDISSDKGMYKYFLDDFIAKYDVRRRAIDALRNFNNPDDKGEAAKYIYEFEIQLDKYLSYREKILDLIQIGYAENDQGVLEYSEENVRNYFKASFLDEFYMKNDFNSLIMTREYSEDFGSSIGHPGYYETSGRFIPLNGIESASSMTFDLFDYSTDRDLYSQQDRLQYNKGDITNVDDESNKASKRSKRKRKIEDFYGRISAYGGEVSSSMSASGVTALDSVFDYAKGSEQVPKNFMSSIIAVANSGLDANAKSTEIWQHLVDKGYLDSVGRFTDTAQNIDRDREVFAKNTGLDDVIAGLKFSYDKKTLIEMTSLHIINKLVKFTDATRRERISKGDIAVVVGDHTEYIWSVLKKLGYIRPYVGGIFEVARQFPVKFEDFEAIVRPEINLDILDNIQLRNLHILLQKPSYYTTRTGTNMYMNHIMEETNSYYQEVVRSRLIGSIYQDSQKYDYDSRMERWKEDEEEERQNEYHEKKLEALSNKRRAQLRALSKKKKK